jgi:hypothetical protein
MPVYVIQAGEGGPCKIGHAANVSRRLAGMQTATHVQLRVVAVYEGGEPEERALHEQFKAVRLKGEWFKLSLPDDLNRIRLAPGPPPPPPVQAEEGAALPGGDRCRLVRGLMKAKGLRLEDIMALGETPHSGRKNPRSYERLCEALGVKALGEVPHSVIYEGVRKNPRPYRHLCEALGVDHQYLRCGRVYVRKPMGSAA